MIIGIARSSAHVLAFQVTSKYENLATREFSDIVWSKSLCFLLHMYFRITNANIANYGKEIKALKDWKNDLSGENGNSSTNG